MSQSNAQSQTVDKTQSNTRSKTDKPLLQLYLKNKEAAEEGEDR